MPLTNPGGQPFPAPGGSSVSFGLVPDDSTPAAYVESEPENSTIFVDYMIMNRYEKDRHVYMMPLTSTTGFLGSSAAFVQLAAPTLLWIADWTACKYGNCPDIPDPNTANTGWVLLDEFYEPAMITVGADGVTPLYRISGTYVYGHVNPSDLTVNNINFARPPWLENSFTRTIPAGKLRKSLIDTLGLNDVFGTGQASKVTARTRF